MINLTIYDKKSVLQLLRSNDKIQGALMNCNKWNDIEASINSVCEVTIEQMEYLKQKLYTEKQ